jgi:lipoyl(octanoyl) transferase
MQQSHFSGPQDDALLLVEHHPVYTLGRRGNTAYVKFDVNTTDHEVHKVERGGDVTYHGPGQLVAYPILNLKRNHKQDLHWYLRQLEEVIIRVLKDYGLDAVQIDTLTGVWVGNKKVAAIGIGVSKWVTMHGFSINVNPDLAAFDCIVPCGLEGKEVGSIQLLSEHTPSVQDVKNRVVHHFCDVFDVEARHLPLIEYPCHTSKMGKK